MNKARKTVASVLLLGGIIFSMLIFPCMFLFLTFFPPAREQMTYSIANIVLYCIWGILAILYPLLLYILCARRFFAVITINEEGISRAVFGRFYKLTLKWDEIYEISYFESLMPFILFSQTKSVQGMSYNQITKIKNLIQIQLTQKNYDVIKQYVKQPIIGLTDAKLKHLRLKK